MKKFTGFERGMGIGGWLTNYKRFHVIEKDKVNVLTIGDLEHFQSYISESDVKNVAEMGFDHIRVCFDQVVLEDQKGGYIDEHFALIERFVQWCQNYKLNVVLNLHKAVGNYCDVDTGVSLFEDEVLQKNFIKLWVELENRLSAYPFVAFELLNEVKDVDGAIWNRLVRESLEAIRAVNKERLVIVGSTCWNSPQKLAELDVYDDERVAYTFHFYDPFEFTHQRGVLQTPTAFYNREMPYPGDIERYRDYQRVVYGNEVSFAQFDKMDKAFLEHTLRGAIAFVKNHPDKILWCGEFGTIRHCKMEWRLNWFRDVVSLFQKYEIPYSAWNYLSAPYDGNRFSLVDDETREILSEELREILLGNV